MIARYFNINKKVKCDNNFFQFIDETYKLGCMNSMAVGVQTPRISLSNNFVKPAPLPIFK